MQDWLVTLVFSVGSALLLGGLLFYGGNLFASGAAIGIGAVLLVLASIAIISSPPMAMATAPLGSNTADHLRERPIYRHPRDHLRY